MMKFVYLVLSLAINRSQAFFTCPFGTTQASRTFKIYYSDENEQSILVPPEIEAPVLRQVYPALLKNIEEYGHPNIPLGSTDGKKCKTVRRMYLENKLSLEEIDILKNMSFIFGELEDVYRDANFDQILGRLIVYEQENKCNYQIPKKYQPDPALGAWVTMVRRLGPEGVPPDQRQKLDAIGFAWKSTRKCGSVFMANYRSIKEKVKNEGIDVIKTDAEMCKWIRAQQEVFKRGKLSENRVGYMDVLLPGLDWTHF